MPTFCAERKTEKKIPRQKKIPFIDGGFWLIKYSQTKRPSNMF
jgi:hypothetical protein